MLSTILAVKYICWVAAARGSAHYRVLIINFPIKMMITLKFLLIVSAQCRGVIHFVDRIDQSTFSAGNQMNETNLLCFPIGFPLDRTFLEQYTKVRLRNFRIRYRLNWNVAIYFWRKLFTEWDYETKKEASSNGYRVRISYTRRWN